MSAIKSRRKIAIISFTLLIVIVIIFYLSNIRNTFHLSYNQVVKSVVLDSEEYSYYKSTYDNQVIEWQGKISHGYTQITGIKFCIIDDEHQEVDIHEPCDWFWALSDETQDADIVDINPSWDGNWVDYILKYYKVPFDQNSNFYNEVYQIKGRINGVDCAASDRCAPDIEIINITKKKLNLKLWIWQQELKIINALKA